MEMLSIPFIHGPGKRQPRPGMSSFALPILMLIVSFSGRSGEADTWEKRLEKARAKAMACGDDFLSRLAAEQALKRCILETHGFARSDRRRATAQKALGEFLKKVGNYKKPESKLRRFLAQQEKAPTFDAVIRADISYALGRSALRRKDNRTALKDFRRAITLFMSIPNGNRSMVARSFKYVVLLCRRQGAYDELDRVFLTIAKKEDKVLAGDVEWVHELGNLATAYVQEGRPGRSLPIYAYLVRALKDTSFFGPRTVANAWLSLGATYRDLKRYDEAERHLRGALAYTEKRMGSESVQTALVLEQLEGMYRISMERPVEARALRRRMRPMLESAKEKLDKLKIDRFFLRADVTRMLAGVHQAEGRYQEAQRLLEGFLNSLRNPHSSWAAAAAHLQMKLGVGFRLQGKYDKAEEAYRKAIKSLEKARRKHRVNLNAYRLGIVCAEQGKHADAVPYFRQSLAYSERWLGKDHIHVATLLNWIAWCQEKLDSHAAALKTYERSLKIARKHLPADHLSIVAILNGTAHALEKLGKTGDAIDAYARCLGALRAIRSKRFGGYSEAEKMDWMQAYRHVWNHLYSLLITKPHDKAYAKIALNAVLAQKGAVLESMSRELTEAVSAGRPEFLRMVKEIARARRELAGLYMRVPPEAEREAHRSKVKNAETRLNETEGQLARARRDKDGGHGSTADLTEALRRSLPEKSVLLSFIRFQRYDRKDPEKPRRVPHYLAVVAFRDRAPVLEDLGPASDLDAAIRDVIAEDGEAVKRIAREGERRAAEERRRKAAALSRLVLGPLWKHIQGHQRWFVSPGGALGAVSFAALPLPKNDAIAVIDRYRVSHVSSGRDLFGFRRERKTPGTAMVLAAPDFGQPSRAERETAVSDLGVEALRDVRWSELPGAREEARVLVRLFEENKISVVTRTGGKATKEALFATASPAILHLATHGFYLPSFKEGVSGTPEGRGLAGVSKSRIRPKTKQLLFGNLSLPLLRSGIVLAGANRPTHRLEGIATALELTGLNLWGTELVVLSACETGLGDVSPGEGSMGLHRSFLQAGARSLLVGVRKVPDRETRHLMTEFYRRFLKGEQKHEALRNAMLACRAARQKEHGAAHPFFWASFVLVGDPN